MEESNPHHLLDAGLTSAWNCQWMQQPHVLCWLVSCIFPCVLCVSINFFIWIEIQGWFVCNVPEVTLRETQRVKLVLSPFYSLHIVTLKVLPSVACTIPSLFRCYLADLGYHDSPSLFHVKLTNSASQSTSHLFIYCNAVFLFPLLLFHSLSPSLPFQSLFSHHMSKEQELPSYYCCL